MKRIAVLALLLAACSTSTMPSNEKKAQLRGIVMKVDTTEMLIHLAPPANERAGIPVVRYNSLTIVDGQTGPGRVENLQPGVDVMIFGRENEDGEIMADRIVVDTPQPRFPR